MFYAHFVLAKKGPLARIWLAAHWDKKLTRAHVFEINIESSVEGILQPKVKMALRTSGHLLLGIVRIYSRKAKYLLADCNEAFVKIKMAFRPGVVDLPEGNREAAVATITLPEVFHDFDSAMPDITIDMDAQVTLNQSRAEDITIKEDYGTLSLMTDDGFDDVTFEDNEVVRDATNIDDCFNQAGLMFNNRPEDNEECTSSAALSKEISIVNLKEPVNDVFPKAVDDNILDNDGGEMFEPGGLFDDEPLGHVSSLDNISNGEIQPPPIDKPTIPDDSDDDDDMYGMGPGSMGPPSLPSSPGTPIPPSEADRCPKPDEDAFNCLQDVPSSSLANNMDDVNTAASVACSSTANEATPAIPEMPPPPVIHTMDHPPPLGHNMEEESFALAPLDATIMQGTERTVKAKRKRKLIVDEVKNISGEEMKSQLSDTSDIVTSLDLAPPTKRLMHWKETGGVEKLFALPGHPILSKTLSRLYQRHLTTRSVENEEIGIDLDPEFEQVKDEESASKRRREMEAVMPQDLTHVNPMNLNRPSLGEPSISHSLDMSQNHLPPPSIFPNLDQPPTPLMGPMISPSPHMVHQMLPDANPLSHVSQMMHSPGVSVDPVSQLPPIPPNMHEMPLAGILEFTQPVHPSVIEPVPEHLISNSLASTVDNQVQQPVLENPLSQSPLLSQVASDPLDHPALNKIVTSDKDVESCINGQLLEIDTEANNDVPQTFPDDQLCFNNNIPSHPDDQPPIHPENNGLGIHNQDPLSAAPFTTANDVLSEHDPPSVVNPVMEDVNSLANQRLPDPSDDDDDYGAPSSVGPMYPEEQMADETYEQFEERILTKRTTHMLHIIHNQLESDKEVKFTELTRNNKRKQVAQKFYTFLVLKKQQAVELQQNGPYDDLTITKGPKFHAVYNAN